MYPKDSVRVLVVEDDFVVMQMIRGRLEEAGYTVAGEASNGRQALEMVQSLRPDVILMDIEMPDIDGIEATRRISNNSPTPIVILTAYDSPDLVERAGQAGAGAYLVKLPKPKELERAISIAMARFADMMELRRLNAELDAFAHTVAHDLQNPLNLIINYAHLLQEQTRLAEPQQNHLNALIHSAHKMHHIIDDLLLLAGVYKTEVELKPLNMGRIVAEAQQRLTHLIHETQAKISFPGQWPEAVGHAPWVEQVWANLLSNGIKYGGRPPHLRLGATARSDGMVRFWVRDNGPGLTPEQQAKLFTPFTRLNHTASGHGLGLSIVKRIVERLGGEVGVESDGSPQSGSLFYFTLPARRTL